MQYVTHIMVSLLAIGQHRRPFGDVCINVCLYVPHAGSHMLAGILHVQITISHFSMPTYNGPAFKGVAHGEEFLRQQLYTSMDLDSGPLNNWYIYIYRYDYFTPALLYV